MKYGIYDEFSKNWLLGEFEDKKSAEEIAVWKNKKYNKPLSKASKVKKEDVVYITRYR